MAPSTISLIFAFVAAAVAVGVFLYWLAARKRIAAETVGRAQDEARRIIRDGEREAETHKKESALSAKEKAHEILMEADRVAQDRRQQVTRLDQAVSKREEQLASRMSTAEQVERDLKAREQATRDREKTSAAAAARYEELLGQQQRELQRVAGLTADEAKEILLKQIEADARRDAANLVKRIEAEARELAEDKARHLIIDAIQPRRRSRWWTCRATTSRAGSSAARDGTSAPWKSPRASI